MVSFVIWIIFLRTLVWYKKLLWYFPSYFALSPCVYWFKTTVNFHFVFWVLYCIVESLNVKCKRWWNTQKLIICITLFNDVLCREQEEEIRFWVLQQLFADWWVFACNFNLNDSLKLLLMWDKRDTFYVRLLAQSALGKISFRK